MGQLNGFLGKYFGLRFANQAIISLTEHVFLLKRSKEIWVLSKLLRTDARTEHCIMAGIQCALGESTVCSAQILIFNWKSEDWKLAVQYEKGLHWVAHRFQRESNGRQICHRQPFTQRNRMVFLFQYPSKILVKIESTLEYSSNSKISRGRDWGNFKSIILHSRLLWLSKL